MPEIISDILRILLLPLTAIFYLAVRVKNFLYDRKILKQKKLPVKIISVGNVSAGGTGKSPFIEFLAEYLITKNFRVGIIARGYGRKSKGLINVFDGNNFIDDVSQTGDELNMIANNLKPHGDKIFIIASEDRVKGAECIINNFNPDIILLDDAFQHRNIFRDIDIVMVDSGEYLSRKLKDRLMLPSGILREPYSEIKNADIVIQNNKHLKLGKIDSLHRLNSNLITANYICKGFYDSDNIQHDIKGKKIISICGIAKPDSFLSMIKSEGGDIIKSFVFNDHHHYTQDDITKFMNFCVNGNLFITTEKDFVKIKYFDKFTVNFKLLFLKLKYKLESTELIDEKIL